MSTSTDGILFFGFNFHAEDDYSEDAKAMPPCIADGTDWEEYYAEQKGLKKPTEKYSEERKEEYAKYWNLKRALVNECPCAIDIHGGEGCFASFVYAKESHLIASRGFPEKVRVMTASPSWFEQIKEFCAIMKIDFQPPEWYLASYWG